MMFRLIRFLNNEAGIDSGKIAGAAVISGIANALVVIIINGAAKHYGSGDLNLRFLMLFAITCVTYIGTRKFVLREVTTIVQNAIFLIRTRMTDKIRRSALLSYENIGRSQILTSLSENTSIVHQGARYFAEAGPAVIMLICSFGYVALIAVPAFWLSVVCIVGAIYTLWYINRSTTADLHRSLDKEEDFVDLVHHSLDGFKEFKINSQKCDDFIDNYLAKVCADAKELKTKAETSLVSLEMYILAFIYVLLGSIAFLLPQISLVSPEQIMSITTVLFFIVGNVKTVVEAVPHITRANVAIDALTRLECVLDQADDTRQTDLSSPIANKSDFRSVRLEQICFEYPAPANETARGFSIGPVDLTVNAGESLFIVGGNGSGKSTLLKLVSGLYHPDSGEMSIDGVALDQTNYTHYRSLFSVIFTDFHLFDRLYGLQDVNPEEVRELIERMRLVQKTKYVDGKFTVMTLSTGQKKRLALIVAILEDKPLYVFDEVAADQDPEFRQYFFDDILPELKRRGKTIIAVTHDDRYFDRADRLATMENGNLFLNSV